MSFMDFIKGIFIGIALVIPGLSGSMFAVVVGLYDKLLNAVNGFTKDVKSNLIFLLPVLAGVAVGILASTKLVLWLCENHLFQSYSFFIGLILGSLPLVYRKITAKLFNPAKGIIFIIAFISIIALSLAATSLGNTEYGKSYINISSINDLSDIGLVFFAGLFSCSLMAIPGVSGSVMLMIINQYGTVYNAVSKMSDMLKFIIEGNIEAATALLPTVLIIAPFLLGAGVGIILVAKVLGYLLSEYESDVYYAVAGLMAGAIIMIFSEGVFEGLAKRLAGGLSGGLLGVLTVGVYITIGYLCTFFFDGAD